MLSRSLLLHKLGAAAVSLGIFMIFAGGLWLLTRYYLYPDHLFWLDGGFQGLRLVLMVDLVLGPLMAFIVFNPAKSRRELRTDIALLAILQFSAMAWGYYQVWEPRPVAMVYGSERFVTVSEESIELQDKTAADLRVYSDEHLPLIYRREPQGQEEKSRFAFLTLKRFIFPESQIWLYEKFAPNRDKVFAASDAILRDLEKSKGKEWQAWLDSHGRHPARDYELALFQGRYGRAVLAFARGGGYVGWLPLGDDDVIAAVQTGTEGETGRK